MLDRQGHRPRHPQGGDPQVLQAFGQGSLAHQTAEGGTGLGLPIVQNLVELHGGTFELRSELRKGTEAIVMPAAKPRAARHAAAAAAGPGAPPPAGAGRDRRASRGRVRAAVSIRGVAAIHSGRLRPHCHCQPARLPTFRAGDAARRMARATRRAGPGRC